MRQKETNFVGLNTEDNSNHRLLVKTIPRRDPSGGDIGSFIQSVKDTLKKRAQLITEAEMAHAFSELAYAEQLLGLRFKAGNIDSCTPNEMGVIIAGQVGPYYQDARQVLIRMHEISGGALSSCITSLPIVEAIRAWDKETSGMKPEEAHQTAAAGLIDPNITNGRGHIAPVFYALRHIDSGMPLCFLLTLHEDLPAVSHKAWGFNNTMRHSLGEGLPIAVGRALMMSQPGTQICLCGDGEFGEGITMEAARIASTHGAGNLIVIIDDNGAGIELQPRPISTDFLHSLFDEVIDLESPHSNTILDHIRKAAKSGNELGLRTAIICRSIKGPHAYTREILAPTSCSYVGSLLVDTAAELGMHIQITTADLATRFGLKDPSKRLNVGLSESGAIGLLMGLPKQYLKVPMTDDKYLHNSLDVLSTAIDECSNFFPVVARKNGTWGGHISSPNVITSALPGIDIFEVADYLDVAKIIKAGVAVDKNAVTLVNDLNIDEINTMRLRYTEENGPFHREPWYRMSLVNERFGEPTSALVITSESVAALVGLEQSDFMFDHLRILERRPRLTKQFLGILSKYRLVAVVEYAASENGLAEYFASRMEQAIVSFSIDGYEYSRSTTRAPAVLSKLREWLCQNLKPITQAKVI